jgi:hypothetical protein
LACDASTQTSFNPSLTGSEPGLDGHNKIEAYTSLTRDDYFLDNGDNFSFNGTLFRMMTETTGGLYNRDVLAKYRYQRYQHSLTTSVLYPCSSSVFLPSCKSSCRPDPTTSLMKRPSLLSSVPKSNRTEATPSNMLSGFHQTGQTASHHTTTGTSLPKFFA